MDQFSGKLLPGNDPESVFCEIAAADVRSSDQNLLCTGDGIDPKNLVAVSLMPCTAKKFECNRPEMNASGYQDVDYVLTTREMARMIKAKGLDLPKLEKSDFDDPSAPKPVPG